MDAERDIRIRGRLEERQEHRVIKIALTDDRRNRHRHGAFAHRPLQFGDRPLDILERHDRDRLQARCIVRAQIVEHPVVVRLGNLRREPRVAVAGEPDREAAVEHLHVDALRIHVAQTDGDVAGAFDRRRVGRGLDRRAAPVPRLHRVCLAVD